MTKNFERMYEMNILIDTLSSFFLNKNKIIKINEAILIWISNETIVIIFTKLMFEKKKNFNTQLSSDVPLKFWFDWSIILNKILSSKKRGEWRP